VGSSVGDRLRKLRRPDASPTAPPVGDLEGLERSLLGEADEVGLTLKQRLERLVAATTRSAVRPSGQPLEEVVQGHRVANERGEFFLIENDLHLETRHGDAPLSRFRTLVPGSVGILTGESELDAFDLTRAVFLDTETTGLAGGTGTAAFLVGIGFVEGDRFRVRQYFMRDYHEEPALLAGLAEELRRFSYLVTFNGKMFDVPLLETRFRLDRARFPLSEAPHLDLLHPARRLWKTRLESCRLQVLESEILGVRRHGDVPGEAIPGIYFDYVRRRDARAMARVFEHNRIDIVSLAALSVAACRWVEEGSAEDPRDVLSLARVLERARLYERSETQYRRAVASDRGALRVAALLRLASRAKRAREHGRAAELWQQAAASGDLLALRELAIHHEHHSRDLPACLDAIERGLAALAARGDGDCRLNADFERRRARVSKKWAHRDRRPSPGRPS
jgi:uncharacterized protein